MSRKAMQVALEALEQIHPGNLTPMAEETWNKAITALRQALETEQEPVAWISEGGESKLKEKIMDREEIIRMAREAGLGDTGVREGFIFFQPGTDGLERFAVLVAAAEREAIAQSLDKQADLACDEIDKQWAQEMAAAVRARGEKA